MKIHKLKKKIAYFTLTIICITILSDQWVQYANEDLIHSNISSVQDKPIALVLGTSKYAYGRQNLFYNERLKAAADLYHSGKVRGILISGDNGRHDYNEPHDMKRDLIKLGVPESYLTCDYAGFRTLDSLKRAAKVFQENKYTIVTQKFHSQRAMFIARYLGHHANAYVAKGPGGYFGFRVRLREAFARVKMLLDLYILNTKAKYLGKLEVVHKRPELSQQ